jgi:hypothetical protein
MNTPNREQIQRLCPEAQEAYARQISQSAQRRLQRWKDARPSRWAPTIDILGFFAVIAASVFASVSSIGSSFMPVVVFGILWGHVAAINRRLEALCTLLNPVEAEGLARPVESRPAA